MQSTRQWQLRSSNTFLFLQNTISSDVIWPSGSPLTIISGELCILLESLTGLIWARNRGWVLLLQISRLGVLCVMISLVTGDHRERGNYPGISSHHRHRLLWRIITSVQWKDILCFYDLWREGGGMEQLFSYCDYYDSLRGEPSPVTVADNGQLITFSPGWGSLTGKLRITVPSYSPEPGTEQEKCCFPHNNHNYSASHSNRNECVGKNYKTETNSWRREGF